MVVPPDGVVVAVVVVAGGEVVEVVTVVVVGLVGGTVAEPPSSNQLLRRPRSAANWSPVKVTEPALPTTVRSSTRPPIWPRPFLLVTSIPRKLPTEGKADSMALTAMSAVQACTGLVGTESPRSGTAGKAPPDV